MSKFERLFKQILNENEGLDLHDPSPSRHKLPFDPRRMKASVGLTSEGEVLVYQAGKKGSSGFEYLDEETIASLFEEGAISELRRDQLGLEKCRYEFFDHIKNWGFTQESEQPTLSRLEKLFGQLFDKVGGAEGQYFTYAMEDDMAIGVI